MHHTYFCEIEAMILSTHKTFAVRIPLRAAITVIVLAVVSACSGSFQPAEETGTAYEPTVQEQGDVRILVSNVSDSGMDALLTGILARNDEGCFGATYENSEDFTLVTFPFGTTLVDTETIELSDGARFRIGDELELGGGFIEQDPTAEEYCGLYTERFLSAPLD